MHKPLRRPSPALIIACLALFVASAGTSIAAGHYLITSTKQIKPSVLKSLKGAKGPKGATGPAGAAGAAGPAGAAGAQGPAGTAKAYAQIVTSNPGNPAYAQNSGFPAGLHEISTGKFCVPAPAGVDAFTVPAIVSLSGGSFGVVTPFSTNAQCSVHTEFEVLTYTGGGTLADGIFFNILVP